MSAHDNEHERDKHDAPDRRPIDLTAMVSGIVFLVMSIAFTVGDLASIEAQVRVVWPSSMLSIGLALLLGARRRSD